MSSLDLTYLNEIADGDEEFILQMLNTFLKTTPEYIAALREAIDGEKWETAGRCAHRIKPTLQYLGLETLKEELYEIEHDCVDMKKLNTIPERFSDFNKKLNNILPEVVLLRNTYQA